MHIIKRITAAVLALLMCACCLAACSDDTDDNRPSLTVWVFSDEYRANLDRATKTAFTAIDWRPEIVVVGGEEMDLLLNDREKLSTLPDVFMLSPDQLPAFIDSDITADLGELGITLDPNLYYGYTIDAATNDTGALKAACYEADPGLFFYRRSLAEFYLGTDDPAQIQDMLCDWDSFYDTAVTLSSQSHRNTRMVTGADEIMRAYLADLSFVRDGRLHIDPKALEFMEYCKKMASEDLMHNAEQWSEAWVAGISDPQSVFGYFSSGLGMENVLRAGCEGTINGEGSYGDWAAVPGPAAYNWGGCWLAAYSGSSMTEEAALFIRHFVCEEEAMRTECLISGTFSANRAVAEQIKFDPQFSESFLSAQNCYSLMAQTADSVTMGNLTTFDPVLRPLFARCVSDYAFGNSTLEQALADFERLASAAFPELAA